MWEALGKMLSAVFIILGYSLIIVPTGFISAELVGKTIARAVSTQTCTNCMRGGHDADAAFCKYCGTGLSPGFLSAGHGQAAAKSSSTTSP